jgi:RNA polymerase sigma factor (sigma-70 family)
MLKLWKATPAPDEAHEELFMQRYERLRSQAMKVAANDRQLGEDLVHEAYVQFTLARPDLNNIKNLDAYLYGMLRKLHMSHLRGSSRVQYASSFLVDYDTLELGMRAMDLGAQIRVQDELRLICHYAFVRKETSKAGSVLLLRFFHGYYPSEIARILRSPRSAVDDWLRIARREAKRYIDDPSSLNFMASATTEFPLTTVGQTSFDVLRGLRAAIFSSSHFQCYPVEELQDLYEGQDAGAISSTMLGTIVSCRQCLDRINQLLGLPALSERYPTDMLGPDTSSRESGR